MIDCLLAIRGQYIDFGDTSGFLVHNWRALFFVSDMGKNEEEWNRGRGEFRNDTRGCW